MKKFLIVLVLLVLPFVTYAQANPCTDPSNRSAQIGECVSQVYVWAIGAAGILGLMVAMIGGYLVIFSGGDASQASRGKSFLYSALIGIALLLGAYLILQTINPDLVQFKFDLNGLNSPVPVPAPVGPAPQSAP